MKESYLSKGRVGVYVPSHPAANNRGYILRYRHVVEQKLGRYLLPTEIVHHKNGNKLDDREENLEVVNKREHIQIHREQGDINLRKLDYSAVESYLKKGLGYKTIARVLGYNQNSVKSAVRAIRRRS